jgi:hypothetical protein
MDNVGTAFDRWLANIVRAAYVLGTVFGWYGLFTGSNINNPLVTYAAGICLAIAVVLHEWLQLRRAKLYRNRAVRAGTDPKLQNHFAKQFWVNFVIGCIILAAGGFMLYNHFSIINGGANLIPGNVAAVIEAVIIPVFAAISTFLTEVEDDPGALLSRMAHTMTLAAVKKIDNQWSQRLASAVQNRRNLAAIAVALMEDAGDTAGASRIRIIEQGLRDVEGTDQGKVPSLYIPPSLAARALGAARSDRQNLTPSKAVSGGQIGGDDGLPKVVKTGTSNPSRKQRAPVKITKTERARRYAVKNPHATLGDIMARTGVSRPTAVDGRNLARAATGTEG